MRHEPQCRQSLPRILCTEVMSHTFSLDTIILQDRPIEAEDQEMAQKFENFCAIRSQEPVKKLLSLIDSSCNNINF